MTKILFMDDMEDRHKKFKMWNIGRIITHVYDAASAIKAIEEDTFDVVSLDHDLTLDTIMLLPPLGKGSGLDVAVHIASMPKEKRPKVVVLHSLNPKGVLRMLEELRSKVEKVYCVPFGS